MSSAAVPDTSRDAIAGGTKRALLAGAVQENVDVRTGRRPAPRRPAAARTPRRAWWLGTVALFLLVASYTLPLAVGAGGEAVMVLGQGTAPVRRLASLPPQVAPHMSAANPLASSVLPLEVRRVVIDPGHGGRDVGTVTPEGLSEAEIALDVARRLRDLLAGRQVEVLMTRDEDREVVLEERAAFANRAEADLFVSIHVNWLEPRAYHGVETFFLGPTDDPYLVELASRENRGSGYSLADARRLLDGIYLDLRAEQSQRFAAAVQRHLHQGLSADNPALRDRGAKPAPFLVLVATEMPAILAEVSSLSNDREAELLATPEYRQQIAEALFAGLESYATSLSRSGA